jgi:glycosyltransferase involved in cell wall biosynthesis
MHPSLVSTIIPVYNRGAMLRAAVASVLAQTWRPLEIIIVDDGSTDDTPEVVTELRAAHPEITHALRQANAGPGIARQRGLEASSGEFIQFLDSDDVLLPRKFELQVRGLQGDPGAGISYGKTYARVGGKRLAAPSQRSGERHREIFPAVLTARLWETSTPLYRRETLQAIGPWSARRQLEDWEFDCRAGAAGVKLHYCDEYLAEYINHDEERLCHLWMTEPSAMRDRISAYVEVLGHAHRAGVPRGTPEMQQFVRSLFWMARNAGSYGLPHEARQLFELARGEALHPGIDYRLFGFASKVLGWQRASRVAEAVERWRA